MTTGIPADDGQQPKKNRSGSNKRQREYQYVVRCAKDEFNEIAMHAREAGLRGAAWLRARGMKKDDPGPRSQRIPPVQNELLIQLQGQLGRLNNNVNQIARGINQGDFYALSELRQVLQDYTPVRDAIFRALGKDPSPAADDWASFAAACAQALAANPDAPTVAIPTDLLRRIIAESPPPAQAPKPGSQFIKAGAKRKA